MITLTHDTQGRITQAVFGSGRPVAVSPSVSADLDRYATAFTFSPKHKALLETLFFNGSDRPMSTDEILCVIKCAIHGQMTLFRSWSELGQHIVSYLSNRLRDRTVSDFLTNHATLDTIGREAYGVKFDSVMTRPDTSKIIAIERTSAHVQVPEKKTTHRTR